MLNWKQITSAQSVIYEAEFYGTATYGAAETRRSIETQSAMESPLDDEELCIGFEKCVAKAIELLVANINDESLYLLFEWHPANGILQIVVVDHTKENESGSKVRCVFPSLSNYFANADAIVRTELIESYNERIKYWLHDYLASCTEFFKYSLVAIFHCDSRKNSELL